MASDRARRRNWTYGVAAVVTVFVLYVTTGVGAGLRAGANLVVTPFSWAVDAVARPLGHFLAGTINYSDVVAQNQKLRYELGRAELRANEAWSFARQLQQLTTGLNVPFVGSLATVSAQVTTVSPTNFSDTIGISKGRDSGILAGMPVVANGGVVGRVIATSARGATIRLITDPNSLVGATFGSGRTTIVVSGQGVDNGLAATSVALSSGVTVGTRVSTDGLNGALYPPGLPLGTVSKVTLTPGAASYNVAIHPTADLRHVAYVDVVLWEPTA